MYALAIIAMALAMIAVGLGFGVRAASRRGGSAVAPASNGMVVVRPASNGMVVVRDPRLSKLLPAIKPARVPAPGPKPKPKPKPVPAATAPANCTASVSLPKTTAKVCVDKMMRYPVWTSRAGTCVAVPTDCNGPRADPSKNLHASKAACEKACAAPVPTAPATAPTAPAPVPTAPAPVPTAPASPAPGKVLIKRLVDDAHALRPAARTDPRLAKLPRAAQAELARLAVRGTATEIRNATVDLGGAVVGTLGGEFAGAPVGPNDVAAINQYLDELSRQPASLLAGN